jgi:ribonuclease HI
MKHTLTDLNDPNELVMFSYSILGNFFFETFFGELEEETSTCVDSYEQSKLLQITHTDEPHCTITKNCTNLDTNNSLDIVPIPCDFSLEVTDPSIWTLYFDGSKNKEGDHAGCLLIDPHGNKTMISCRVEFECTNNVLEYEALVQGLRKELDLKIKCIEVFEDSQIVVRQVRNSINCTSIHLKNYQREVWDLMNNFEAFNIKSIPCTLNSEADLLANAASNLCPSDNFSHDKFLVELIYRPSIPDNIMNWRVFEDDERIINFLHSEDTFKGSVIDDEQHESLLQASTSEDKPKYSKAMPKNIVRLEKLFDLQEKFRRPTNTKTRSSTLLYEVVNLGTKQDPKNINLGKNYTHAERTTFMKLFKEFNDVFIWTYGDLKTYDMKIIQHVIPLKEDAKPFLQKLRKMHPSLEPLVKKELNKLLVAKIIFLV